MTVFGNSAIDLILNQGNHLLGEVINKDVSLALFAFLEQLPLSGLFGYVALLMIVLFFITSADSGALVMDMLCSHGKGSHGLRYRLFWSVGAGVVAIALLLAGGLGALQTMAIASALPFVTVLMVAMYGLFKALHVDAQKQAVLQQNLSMPLPAQGSDAWRERLRVIMDFPSRQVVSNFVDTTVKQACDEVVNELQGLGVDARVIEGSGHVMLTTNHGSEMDFVYQVRLSAHTQPNFVQNEDDDQNYYRAEVHLGEGGQDYDIMGWSKEGVINDIVSQYHRHMHFLHRLR